ncbi:class I SAM-dependent methyltransferase [soil metagenome]
MDTTSQNIVQTGTASRSAMRVATLRAVHHLLDEPIVFDDPIALPILGAQMAAAMREDPFQFNDPMSRGLRAAVLARSRFAEEELRKAVQVGVKQYIVLGAGLDTFAYRNIHAAQGLQVFEVDHPSTQEWKKSLLRDAGIPIPDSMRFAGVDFESKSLAQGLKDAGFDASQPAFFSWLGVTLYLTREAIFDTLRFVASLPKGSAIAFDYGVQRSLLNPIEQVINEVMGKIIGDIGEPWISFFDPALFKSEVQALGYGSIEDLGPEELNLRYFLRRRDGLRTGGGARMMCAKV